MNSQESPRDPVDAVLAALGRIRGRRRPGPGGPGGRRGGWGERRREHHEHPRVEGAPEWWGGPGTRLGGPARVRLLDALAAASAPLSVSEVAEAVGVDQPRASRLIQQAVELGLVQREADPDDARRTRVALTEQGSGIAHGVRGHRHETVRTALDAMTDDERAEFVRLLTKFASAWPED